MTPQQEIAEIERVLAKRAGKPGYAANNAEMKRRLAELKDHAGAD